MIKINNIEINEKELEKLGWTAPKKTHGRQRVEYEDDYFCSNALGTVRVETEKGSEIDGERFALGNYYLTAEECQHAVDVQRATVRVQDRIRKANGGWITDFNSGEGNYYVEYDHQLGRLDWLWVEHSQSMFDTSWYIKSEEIANQIIEECKYDLLLIFGVK